MRTPSEENSKPTTPTAVQRRVLISLAVLLGVFLLIAGLTLLPGIGPLLVGLTMALAKAIGFTALTSGITAAIAAGSIALPFMVAGVGATITAGLLLVGNLVMMGVQAWRGSRSALGSTGGIIPDKVVLKINPKIDSDFVENSNLQLKRITNKKGPRPDNTQKEQTKKPKAILITLQPPSGDKDINKDPYVIKKRDNTKTPACFALWDGILYHASTKTQALVKVLLDQKDFKTIQQFFQLDREKPSCKNASSNEFKILSNLMKNNKQTAFQIGREGIQRTLKRVPDNQLNFEN